LWPEVVRRVLRLCTEGGVDQLSRLDSQKLLLPLLRVLAQRGQIAGFQVEIAALTARPDVWDTGSVRLLRKEFPDLDREPSMGREPAHSPQAADVTTGPTVSGQALAGVEHLTASRLPHDLPDLADAARMGSRLVVVAQSWLDRRDSYPPEARATGDTWILTALSLANVPYPDALASALYRDDDIWMTESVRRFASGLPKPLGDEVGLGSSVLINGRLRYLAPRLFLRYPATLVPEPVGRWADLDEVTQSVMDSVADPLLRTVGAIEKELNRPKRAPRRSTITEIRDHLGQVISSMGYGLVGRTGEKTKYNLEEHVSFGAVEPDADVVVIKPGLRWKADGRVRVKAQVKNTGSLPTDEEDREDDD
jgi:hypothetical protein